MQYILTKEEYDDLVPRSIYVKRCDVKEEIIYAGLSNTLEFVMTIWIMRNLHFLHALLHFPEFYITLFFGTMTLVEIGIIFIRYKIRLGKNV